MVGQRAIAYSENMETWYSCTVSKDNGGGKFTIEWDDGDVEDTIKIRDHIKLLNEAGGSRPMSYSSIDDGPSDAGSTEKQGEKRPAPASNTNESLAQKLSRHKQRLPSLPFAKKSAANQEEQHPSLVSEDARIDKIRSGELPNSIPGSKPGSKQLPGPRPSARPSSRPSKDRMQPPADRKVSKVDEYRQVDNAACFAAKAAKPDRWTTSK